MSTVRIALEGEIDWDGFRAAARRLIAQGVPPEEASWSTGTAADLFVRRKSDTYLSVRNFRMPAQIAYRFQDLCHTRLVVRPEQRGPVEEVDNSGGARRRHGGGERQRRAACRRGGNGQARGGGDTRGIVDDRDDASGHLRQGRNIPDLGQGKLDHLRSVGRNGCTGHNTAVHKRKRAKPQFLRGIDPLMRVV